jgi:2-iminobutanoate/2-iminopropanoate deaminase
MKREEMRKTVVNPRTVFNSTQYGFSQAIIVQGGRRVLLSGQVGVDEHENTVGATLQVQTDSAIDNIEKILSEIGGSLSDVVILRLYIVDSEKHNQGCISEALRTRFPVDPPVTSWIMVSGLSEPEWLIEIEAEAALPDGES